MKRFLAIAGLILAGVFAGGFVATLLWPQKAATAMLSGFVASAGLTKHTVEMPFGPVHYLEGGEGETVVFLHGIYALKEHWVDMSRKVSGDYRVVLLDLPGFGENPRLDPTEYDLTRQSRNVAAVLDALGVQDYHLAANSMSAQIAFDLAQAQPARVKSVALIGSPINVTSPEPSEMELAMQAGQAPLVVTSEATYEARMGWLFPKVPFLPKPIMDKWKAEEVAYGAINGQIWEAVEGSDVPMLETLAPAISQPALIVWCQDDRIFHPTGAAVLDDALPDSKLITPAGCGHLPMLDRKGQTGKDYVAFLNGL